MYETYLQNEGEWEEKFGIYSNYADFCPDKEEYKSHNRLSLIKVMKALEEKLEGEKQKLIDLDEDGYHWSGVEDKPRRNTPVSGKILGLQLSLDKIREFISQLESE